MYLSMITRKKVPVFFAGHSGHLHPTRRFFSCRQKTLFESSPVSGYNTQEELVWRIRKGCQDFPGSLHCSDKGRDNDRMDDQGKKQ
jgi:hypothetical protein